MKSSRFDVENNAIRRRFNKWKFIALNEHFIMLEIQK